MGTLAVGRVFTESAFVVNTTAKPVDVYVYPADGIPARGGGYGYATRATPMTAVGRWLRVSSARMTLPGNSRKPITLRLLVPATATNGLHVGAVVVEPVDANSASTFTTITRYAMPVSMTVTGGRPPSRGPSGAPRPRGGPVEVTDLRPHPRGSKVCPTVLVTNNSGAAVSPRIRVTTDGWFGGSSRVTTIDPVAPGASRVVQLLCVRRPIGPGNLRVRVEEPASDAAVGAHLFWVPLPLVLSLLLLLLLIAALLTTFARGWLRQREQDDPPNAAASSSKELDGNPPD